MAVVMESAAPEISPLQRVTRASDDVARLYRAARFVDTHQVVVISGPAQTHNRCRAGAASGTRYSILPFRVRRPGAAQERRYRGLANGGMGVSHPFFWRAYRC